MVLDLARLLTSTFRSEDTIRLIKTVLHHHEQVARRLVPAAVSRAGEHFQVSISAGAFGLPGPTGLHPTSRIWLVRPGTLWSLLKQRWCFDPCVYSSGHVQASRTASTRRDNPIQNGNRQPGRASCAGLIGAGGTSPGEDRQFGALAAIILPGTAEQTQDIANFAPRDAISLADLAML